MRPVSLNSLHPKPPPTIILRKWRKILKIETDFTDRSINFHRLRPVSPPRFCNSSLINRMPAATLRNLSSNLYSGDFLNSIPNITKHTNAHTVFRPPLITTAHTFKSHSIAQSNTNVILPVPQQGAGFI